MIRAPRSCTRTDHIFPCTTLFRSIDFFLPVLSYPRRRIILEALHARGYHVRSSDLTLPAYIYRSLMGRSKAIIDINRFEGATHMSPMRICNGASNGIAVISEQFDTSEFADRKSTRLNSRN